MDIIKKANINSKKLYLYILIYKTVIELVYILSISKIYDYTGLTLNINQIGFWISQLYLLVLIILFPRDKSRPSTYLFLMFVLFLVIPTFSYYWLNNQSILYTTFILLCCIIISLLLKINVIKIYDEIKFSNVILKVLFLFYILITVYLIIKRGGIDTRALNFDSSSIYELRSEFTITGIWGYILNWCAKVFCPFFFAYFFYKKKRLNMLLILLVQLLLYFSYGYKAYLFSIGLLLMVVLVMKKDKFERDFTLGLTSIIIISLAMFKLNITNFLFNSIPFRLVFVPAQIQFEYFEFFSERNKMFFADGVIGKLFNIESPFNEPVPFVISKYFHGVISNSNTGVFSDAFANGGFIMMVIFALLLGVIFIIIDSITSQIPKYIVVASLSYMIFVLNDNSLLTTLLTGGLFLMILFLFLFNSSIKNEYK